MSYKKVTLTIVKPEDAHKTWGNGKTRTSEVNDGCWLIGMDKAKNEMFAIFQASSSITATPRPIHSSFKSNFQPYFLKSQSTSILVIFKALIQLIRRRLDTTGLISMPSGDSRGQGESLFPVVE